jgi:hypothetical protein
MGVGNTLTTWSTLGQMVPVPPPLSRGAVVTRYPL